MIHNNHNLSDIRDLMASGDHSRFLECVRAWAPDSLPCDVVLAAYRACKAFDSSSDETCLWLDRSLDHLPENTTLLRDRGVIYQQRGQWSDAASCYQKASSLRPDIASYHALLGIAYYKLGHYVDAIKPLQMATSLKSDEASWWVYFARALVHTDNLAQAAEAYEKALSLKQDISIEAALNAVLAQIKSGSREAPVSYYDQIFSKSEKYQLEFGINEYEELWRRIVSLIQDHGNSVLDFGCGPGQFAGFLSLNLPDVSYVGLDFSDIAINNARRRYPQYRFERRMLPLETFDDIPKSDVLICAEVLEHVEKDLDIMESIPAGMFVIASVPNFDSFGHLRVFQNENDVIKRYGYFMETLTLEKFAISDQNFLWLFYGQRGSQSYHNKGP